MENYKRILVGVDGSDQADRAFKKALELALKYQATLGVASVVDLRSFSPNVSYDGSLEERAKEAAKARIAGYRKEAEKAGLENIATYVESGNPKTILAKNLPEEFEADLIVVGATGLNRVEKIVLGSISSYVLGHAHVDTLIAR
ncbi:universal stress protein family [Listeria fleischmannii 1991]|jgi:nucleotide-binding universal stress UspA family protein|uniref:Universal stress protein SAV1710 n=4 Tax=Listeria fleischmannii TaxID=1069827 RepID=A0A2X3HE57_9LIST|nr:universal stress protein [Listeria fleischmannii]EMG27547.1 putative universal stress protein UspA [Listeria fleischmannii subsp. fleischmannii LU2006-1]EUJ52449.1 universal stress protein family [Listeria fleischmannii FSL S10-1203]KMT59211.1 universal stress protein family [Listeria fleischmannii 1991]MBC1398762.1 universal stress protein [Listeria fleischmannii]MBC1418123.1 universal stress protein [Listeria fleischmannii]